MIAQVRKHFSFTASFRLLAKNSCSATTVHPVSLRVSHSVALAFPYKRPAASPSYPCISCIDPLHAWNPPFVPPHDKVCLGESEQQHSLDPVARRARGSARL